MGIISKQVHKRQTRRITAPVTAVTPLAPDEVRRELQVLHQAAKDRNRQAVEAMDQMSGLKRAFNRADLVERERLYVTEHFDEYKVSFPFSSQESRPKSDGVWIARVQIGAREGGSTVVVQMESWVEQDGSISNKKAYLAFLDDFARAIGGEVEG